MNSLGQRNVSGLSSAGNDLPAPWRCWGRNGKSLLSPAPASLILLSHCSFSPSYSAGFFVSTIARWWYWGHEAYSHLAWREKLLIEKHPWWLWLLVFWIQGYDISTARIALAWEKALQWDSSSLVFAKDKRGKDFVPGKLPWWTATTSLWTHVKIRWTQRKSDRFLSVFSLQ